jgi:hypothetical protein
LAAPWGDDRPRPGKEPTITAEARGLAGVVDLPQGKGTGLSARIVDDTVADAREHGPPEGHTCLGKLAEGTVCKILNEEEGRPRKVRYYLEPRDPELKAKMGEVLCVYREVKIIKEAAAAAKQKPSDCALMQIRYSTTNTSSSRTVSNRWNNKPRSGKAQRVTTVELPYVGAQVQKGGDGADFIARWRAARHQAPFAAGARASGCG